ncbi:MAG: DUF2975 domain-containing protein [Patescibacteria group bacterium]|nr:DUF2975 domain-containing protein [Patescibacteria group bacterium]
MKAKTIKLLQTAIILSGTAVLFFMLAEPRLEGRNAHATLLQIYCRDAFLAYVYCASIPFFIILYQAFKILENARGKKIFSDASLPRLKMIEYLALSLIGLALIGEIIIAMGPSDDRAGGIFMGLMSILISGLIASTAASLSKRIKNIERDK